MQSVVEVSVPGDDISLVTLYEAKVALGIAQSDTSKDDQLELLIKWASADIETLCNRVFAKETMQETVLDVGSSSRLYLSHWPIRSIESVRNDSGDLFTSGDGDFIVDNAYGYIRKLGGDLWDDTMIVSYTGGYDLPFEAPVSLQRAALLMAKEAYYSVLRGDSTVRMISHKESRIMYYDPNAALRGGGGGGGTPGSGNVGTQTQRAVNDLLRRFMRFCV